jgi:hypothetical protein
MRHERYLAGPQQTAACTSIANIVHVIYAVLNLHSMLLRWNSNSATAVTSRSSCICRTVLYSGAYLVLHWLLEVLLLCSPHRCHVGHHSLTLRQLNRHQRTGDVPHTHPAAAAAAQQRKEVSAVSTSGSSTDIIVQVTSHTPNLQQHQQQQQQQQQK